MKTVSIIIPTFNRVHFLKECLESIGRQTYPGDMYETIVVDDGSTDGTLEFLEQHCQAQPRIRHIRCQHGGPARARNAGIRIARGEWIAFTDDDCLPSTTWLEQASRHFETEDIAIVEGRTISESPDVGVCDRTMNISKSGGFATCNVFYRKTALESVSGFDSAFPTYREDTDLAWRLFEKNPSARAVFEDQATVCHRTNHYSVAGLLGQAMRLKRAYYDAKLCKRHPQNYRRQFALLGFFNPTSALTYPLILFTTLAVVSWWQSLSLFTLVLGILLVFYSYAVTVLLYFSIHGGVYPGRMAREPKATLRVMCVWWFVLLTDLLGGIYGALRHRTALF